MPFSIALQDQLSNHFREASNTASAAIAIVERKGDREIPVARLEPLQKITAAEMKMLAINIKDYLNKMPLEYRFGEDNRELRYGPRSEDAPLADGIMFRFYYTSDAIPPTTGNSIDIAVLQIDQAYKGQVQKRIDEGDFATLIKQGSEKERRGTLRGRDPQLQSANPASTIS